MTFGFKKNCNRKKKKKKKKNFGTRFNRFSDVEGLKEIISNSMKE